MVNQKAELRSLAFFGLFSPKQSGMVDYTEDLARELGQEFELVFYYGPGNPPNAVAHLGRVRPVSEYRQEEDLALFQICNNTDLSYQYELIKETGGVVVLHDEVLFDLLYGVYQTRWKEYLREVLYNEGLRGLWYLLQGPKLSPRAYAAQIRQNLLEHPDRRSRFPCSKRMSSSATALVVHSQSLAKAARAHNPSCPLAVIPHGVHEVAIPRSKQASREKLKLERMGIGPESLVCVSFGFLQRHKRLDVCLQAFARFHAQHPDSHYLLIGPRDPEFDVEAQARLHGVEQAITVLDGFLPMPEVNEHLNASNVALNLRWPTMGASSGTLYKCLAAGLPVVVTNEGSFSEFPDSCVFRVERGADEVERIAALLHVLQTQPELAQSMGQAARELVEREYSWPVVGKAYAEFLRATHRALHP